MQCAICMQYPSEPVECQTCKCPFCKDCVDKWSKKANTCANGCENAVYGKVHPFFWKTLSALKIKCKNEGCEEEFLLDFSKSHLSSCSFSRLRCSYCSEEVLRKDVPKHREECVNFDCQECGALKAKRKTHSCINELKEKLGAS